MKVEIDLPEIKGYEYTGEFRQVRHNEYFYVSEKEATLWDKINRTCGMFPILKKVEASPEEIRKFKKAAMLCS